MQTLLSFGFLLHRIALSVDSITNLITREYLLPLDVV